MSSLLPTCHFCFDGSPGIARILLEEFHEILQYHVFKCGLVALLIPCRFMIPVFWDLSSHKIPSHPVSPCVRGSWAWHPPRSPTSPKASRENHNCWHLRWGALPHQLRPKVHHKYRLQSFSWYLGRSVEMGQWFRGKMTSTQMDPNGAVLEI